MKKTGEILKAAREEKGLSLNEVALSLKISSKVLKAIEEGDESQLPAKTFLRGFVKSYATFLRLDADKILESFYEEMGSTRPQPYIRPGTTPDKDLLVESKGDSTESTEATVTPIRKTAPASTSNDYSPLNKKNNTKTIVAVVLLCVLAGLIIFTKKMIDKYSKEAEVPPSVAQTMEGVTPVDGETPTLTEPLTSQSPTPNSSSMENMTKADSEKLEPLSKATPVATPKASPSVTPSATETAKASPTPSATHTPSATPSPSPTASASATASASPSPSASPTPEKPKPVELIVEALDTVEIEYSSPNGKPQKIKLSAEQVHTFKSKSGLKISFSNGGAVNLILNGKELGIPGDLGKPIKLSY